MFFIMNCVPYTSGIGSIANAIIIYHSKFFFQMSSALRGKKGLEWVLTKIIKQLSKDDPKFAEDWSLVSSWKYGIGWTISTLL